jgi:hypothetical protein
LSSVFSPPDMLTRGEGDDSLTLRPP